MNNDPWTQNQIEKSDNGDQCKDPSFLYQEAMGLLKKCEFTRAAEAFEALGQYADAPKFSIYSKAAIAGENDDFSTACDTFKLLGDFYDSPQLILYYRAREIESKGIDSYLEAIKAYTDIIETRDCKTRILNCQRALYERAVALFETQKYAEATRAFEVLGDYSDSYFMKVYCEALKAEREENYIAASDKYKSIAVFKDSLGRANECKQKQLDLEERKKQEQYDSAVKEYKANHYCAAFEQFNKITGYKDVDMLLEEPPFKVLMDIQSQDRLNLGLYPQVHPKHPDIIQNWSSYGYSDNYIIDEVKNGTVALKPIEWLIKGRYNNKYVLVSEYGLEAMAYDKNGVKSWEDSSVRFWLNSYFYDKAFNASEKELFYVENSNGVDNEKKQQDKVTLLSKSDAQLYFINDYYIRLCSPTIYAVANGASGDVSHNRLICWWWLRTPGKYITLGGDIDDSGVKDGRGVVRPVISINIDNLVEGIVNGKIDSTKISGRKSTRL